MKYLSVLFILFFTSSAYPQREKWTALFNGKNLNGWTRRGGQASYSTRNGTITGSCTPNTPNTFLCTETEYGDFILELELSVDDGLNSGIQIRSHADPAVRKGAVYGLQVEVDPSPRAWSGGIYDEGRRDWLCIPNNNPEGKKAFRAGGQWNRYRIEAIGNTIRTWVNDIPVAFLVDTLKEKGFIGLQVHSISRAEDAGKQVRWRNIRIQTGRQMHPRPWDQCPVLNLSLNTLCEQEKSQGWRLLFNGQNLEGWRPNGAWTVHNGELQLISPTGKQHLLTLDSFSAFELSFDFRLTEGANSGVKYFILERDTGLAGLEYQLLDNERHPDAKQGAAGNRTLASLYDLIPSYPLEARFQRPISAWNQGRIVVRPDNIVQHWLNGFKVVEYERGSNIFAALVARSKFAGIPGFGTVKSSPVLLQDHHDPVAFRNIKIRELK